MLIGDSLYTKQVGNQVASGIKYLVEHPEDDSYLELKVVRIGRTSGMSGSTQSEMTFSVRLISDFRTRIVSLASGGEIIRLITSDNKRLDILFGPAAEREIEPALVLVEA